ncbi:MAG: hypothetical protein ABIR37_02025 [Candidatus Saccharimonadales bacterium]
MLETYEQHSRKKLVATVIAIVVIAGAVVFADHIKAENLEASTNVAHASASTAAATDSSTSVTNASTTTATTSSGYKDGAYMASRNYYVPHGNESIAVSLTLSGGVVTDVSIRNSEGDNESARYQQDFASAYKSYVVGKKINGLQLGIIAGASDTTQGFDDALSQIAAKAQA